MIVFAREALGLPPSISIEVFPFEGRGSDRAFFRLRWDRKDSAILVYYDPKRVENAYYADIAGFLREIDIPAPRLIRHDPAGCLIVIEDLGDLDLWSFRETPWETRRAHYQKTLTIARRLHSFPRNDFPSARIRLMEGFGPHLYRLERDYFKDHFVRDVGKIKLGLSFEGKLEEELSGQEPITVFGKACRKLGIRIIPANSPQAKGRVERKNGVFQDRWVKELRLKGISDIENANRLLPLFTDKMNDKFAVEPASSTDYHQQLPEGLNLEDIFCWEETRTLGNDWTVRFENRWFQIPAQSNLPPSKGRVMVRKRLDGSLQILYRNQSVDFEELLTKPVQKTIENSKQRTKWIPAPDHPWRNSRKIHQGSTVSKTGLIKEPPLEAGAARVTVTLDLTP